MTVLALVFAGIAAMLHIVFFKLEAIDWRKPKTWKTFGLESQADADTTASLAFNQGFYNLFLAIGTAVGIAIVRSSDTHDNIGWTLILFGCASMLAASLVLISSGGKAFARAAAIQGVPPLIAIIATVIAIN